MAFKFSVRSVLTLPFWVAQLGTGAKSFVDNPLIGSRRLNQLGLHRSRVRLAHFLAAQRRRRLASRVAVEHRQEFAENGFVVIRDFMPPEAFAALREAIMERSFPAREMVQGDTITRRIALDPEFLKAVPAASALIANPVWRGLMRYVSSFSTEPLYYVQAIIRDDPSAPADPQTALHADTFHPTMKAWFFLTDVGEDEGPFTYVPGSHRLTKERLDWETAQSLSLPSGTNRLADRGSLRIMPEELPILGLPPAKRLAVPANTLVVADTTGFHARGPSTGGLARAEIWAYSRRNPFLPWTGLDLLSLPGLAELRVPALWALRDRLEAWVGQPWRDVGVKAPLETERSDCAAQ
jgi:hypothetical protein